MRSVLRPLVDERRQFIGRVDKFGSRHNNIPTLMLDNVFVFNGDEVEYVGHLWVRYGYDIESLFLVRGEVITFFARVRHYLKTDESEYGVTDVRSPKRATDPERIDFGRWEKKMLRIQAQQGKKKPTPKRNVEPAIPIEETFGLPVKQRKVRKHLAHTRAPSTSGRR
jgi:hypothetical protein